MKSHILSLLFWLTCILLLVGVIRGGVDQGQLLYQTEKNTAPSTPFEASNSNSRYALVEAIVDSHSFFFTPDQAALATPDLVRYHDNYFSIFTPGVSFLAVPFYYLGKLVSAPQLVTFLLNIVAALINVYLIYRLCLKLGSSPSVARMCGFLFLFGTNALAYSLSLTQHHLSTLFLLLGLDNSLRDRSLIPNLLFGLYLGIAVLIDIPNLFMFLPLGAFIFFRHVSIVSESARIKFAIRPTFIAVLFALLPLVALFGWYNYQLTGSYTKLGQTIGRTDFLPDSVTPPPTPQPNSSPGGRPQLVLNPRALVRGLAVLVTSRERTWWYYSPVLLVSLLGLSIAVKSSASSPKTLGLLAFSVMLIVYVTYGMFGDPWGGWAFGGRYLIPAAAMACVLIAPALTKFARRPLFVLPFFALSFYSLYIATLGAVSTTLVPPKVEVDAMPDPIPYTYQRNIDLLNSGVSSSLVYNWLLANKLSPMSYANYYAILSGTVFAFLYLHVRSQSK